MIKNHISLMIITLAMILAAGWGTIACSEKTAPSTSTTTGKAATSKIYSCPMHPEIQQDHAGKCSICGMDLVLEE